MVSVVREVAACLVVATCILGTACAPRATVRPVPDPEAVIALLRRQNPKLESLRGTGRLRVSRGERRFGAFVSLLYQRPDRMRIDLTGPLGMQLGAVAVDGDSVWVSVPITGQFYQGTLDEIVSSELGLMTDEVIILGEAFSGSVPLPDLERDQNLSVEEVGRKWIVRFNRSDGEHRLVADQEEDLVRTWEWWRDGRLLRTVVYHDFYPADGMLRPWKVTATLEQDSGSVELTYDEQHPNAQISPDEFRL
jgi:outer membrane lipoprotein-sorting protein